PASMDRALDLAKKHKAELVLATDPDADRLGAMAPVKLGGEEWRVLNGNTIAALLTYFKLSRLAEQGRMPSAPIVVKTLVTSSQVTRIARHFQAQSVDNLLVGFKYIAEVLWQLEQSGVYEEVRGTPEDFIIGCEESHGILVTPHIRDKDAAGAALLLAELAVEQKRQGRTVIEYLGAIERRFGYFHNEVRTITLPGIEGKQTMAKMLDKLRASPPRRLAGLAVTDVDDLQNEKGWMGPFRGATDRS